MSERPMNDETSVFTFGSLACEGVAIPPADAYASRQAPLHRVSAVHTGTKRAPVMLILLLASGCAVTLLILTLLGQARLAKLNDSMVEAEAQYTRLQETNRLLQIEAEKSRSYELSARPEGENAPADTATVLHVRRGRCLTEGWELVVDTVTECFH